MKDLNFNQAFQDLVLSYQIKLIDTIISWDEEMKTPTAYNVGTLNGLKKAKELFIETIEEMETKYNETL